MEAKKINKIVNSSIMLERFKEIKKFQQDKEVAQFIGQSAQSLNNKKQAGTIWKDLLACAINENMDLNWLMKGEKGTTYINGYIGNNVINNGSSNHVDGLVAASNTGSVNKTVTKESSSSEGTSTAFKEKLAYVEKLASLKKQGLMTEAQYKKAMDELWGV